MGQLYYKIQNENKKQQHIILLHGLFGDHKNLQGLARFLKTHYPIISVDLCNHGQSYHCDHMDYLQMADDIKQLIEQLQLKSTVLIGHSMGGKVAMACALRHPELVDKLVVLDIAPVNYNLSSEAKSRHNKEFEGLQAVSDSQVTQRTQALEILSQYINKTDISNFLVKSFTINNKSRWAFNIEALRNDYLKIMGWPSSFTTKPHDSTHDSTDGSNLDHDVYNKPTLFIKAELSDYIHIDYKQHIETQFLKAKGHIILNCGHWLHAQKPEQIARIIHDFLQNEANLV